MIASTDPKRVLSWIGTGKKPVNLAIATGRFSPVTEKYLTIVDGDLVEHPLLRRLQSHSTTVTQRSGGGGDHAFYWSKLPVKNSCQLVEEKVDIRGSGGILVIAPSTHISGNRYEFTCDFTEVSIQDMPEFLEKKLKLAIADRNKKASPVKKESRTKGELPELTQFWQKKSVNQVRDQMRLGELIPLGVRNVTMHRLLSSDRARGTASKAELMVLARGYLPFFEDPDSFEGELETIVKSVAKYPAYNTSHEKVNEVYLAWLGKNGYKKVHDLETLERMDQQFFDSLTPTTESEPCLTLQQVADLRTTYLQAHGLTKFATYRSQLLAKKLLSKGISRKRTAQGNFWAVKPLDPIVPSLKNNQRMECLNMTEELKDEEQKKAVKDGDIIDYHGSKVRVELIKTETKVKEHSREHLYHGKTGYEYNKAMTALLPRLTEEMMDELADGQLVMDEAKTKEWTSQVKVGDVIGVKTEKLQVISVNSLSLLPSFHVTLVAPVKQKVGEFMPVEEDSARLLEFPEMDHARELGLLDILWRDGKPFGEPATKDMTVVLLHDLEEDTSAPKTKKGKKKSP